MSRKTQITIETHSLTIIRARRASRSVLCGVCGQRVSAFAAAEIAEALRLSTAAIEALYRSGEIHSPVSGSDLVCGNSLAEVFRSMFPAHD